MYHVVCTICNLEKLNMDWVGVFEGKRTGTTPTWQQSDGKKRGGVRQKIHVSEVSNGGSNGNTEMV
jgi:hypothetical protein